MEEPLEIRLVYGPAAQRKIRSLSVTMRTPGNDFDLAVGFLISEGIVTQPAQIIAQRFAPPFLDGSQSSNVVEIELSPDTVFEFSKLQRHFYTTSSCGVCGKASLDAIRADQIRAIQDPVTISADIVQQLPDSLSRRQTVFQKTGGLHAAGLVTLQGEWVAVYEDVGRHNAVDKLVGSQVLRGTFPITQRALVLSGRASFELMQKALLARIPIVVAVGAPSSLAVELAREFNLTLIGFASQHRFNVYSAQERVTV